MTSVRPARGPLSGWTTRSASGRTRKAHVMIRLAVTVRAKGVRGTTTGELVRVDATRIRPVEPGHSEPGRARGRDARDRREKEAEGEGFEPSSPCGRRFSRPVHCRSATPPGPHPVRSREGLALHCNGRGRFGARSAFRGSAARPTAGTPTRRRPHPQPPFTLSNGRGGIWGAKRLPRIGRQADRRNTHEAPPSSPYRPTLCQTDGVGFEPTRR